MEKQQKYIARVSRIMPKSSIRYNCFKAFFAGGTICLLGEIVRTVLKMFDITDTANAAWTSVIMIFLGALLTGLGVYDKIGKFGGAGALVPITGFANGITSPAMEFKTEGYVLGLGAKMFIIAGPVIVYGTLASSLAGLIYYIVMLIQGAGV